MHFSVASDGFLEDQPQLDHAASQVSPSRGAGTRVTPCPHFDVKGPPTRADLQPSGRLALHSFGHGSSYP